MRFLEGPTSLFEIRQGEACGVSWLEGMRAKPCLPPQPPALEAAGRHLDFSGLQRSAYRLGLMLLAFQLSSSEFTNDFANAQQPTGTSFLLMQISEPNTQSLPWWALLSASWNETGSEPCRSLQLHLLVNKDQSTRSLGPAQGRVRVQPS